MMRTVAIDERHRCIFELESKNTSKQWHHSRSPKPNKTRAALSAGEVMVTVSFEIPK